MIPLVKKEIHVKCHLGHDLLLAARKLAEVCSWGSGVLTFFQCP